MWKKLYDHVLPHAGDICSCYMFLQISQVHRKFITVLASRLSKILLKSRKALSALSALHIPLVRCTTYCFLTYSGECYNKLIIFSLSSKTGTVSTYDSIFKRPEGYNEKLHRCDREHAKSCGLKINEEVTSSYLTVTFVKWLHWCQQHWRPPALCFHLLHKPHWSKRV